MKGGINFEEWKEIVKKNRRSLRSKSNSFKFEPESLTYGAEKAVKSPEYGQIHTITYNVTGIDTSEWPTEIKSGQTLALPIEIPEGYELQEMNVSANYTYENGILAINNVQSNVSIEVTVSKVINIQFVDLGLPSGTLWANMNMGATVETDYGDYYQYGSGAQAFTHTNYKGKEVPLDSSADSAT